MSGLVPRPKEEEEQGPGNETLFGHTVLGLIAVVVSD